ncbi:cytochrome [Pseudofrankia sp. EUN1h]|nr:cytochrome [Pseudofrankia sp. EUN1h]
MWPSSRRFRDATPAEKLVHLAEIRDQSGLAHFDEPAIPGLPKGGGYFAVTRHADVVDATRRPADFSSAHGTLWINDLPADLNELYGSIISMDAPRHSRLRRIVATAFTPRAIRALHHHIGQAATDTVRAAVALGEFDFVTDLATPFPLTVICDLLGIPDSYRAEVLAASNVIVSGGDPDLIPDQTNPVIAFLDAGRTLTALATDLAEHRRHHPADDLVTTLVHAQVDGGRLTIAEIAAFVTLLTFAGQETTRNTIALGYLALHRNPAARREWAADYERLAPTAIEELLRHTSPVAFMRRTVTRDTTLGGQHLAAGEKIILYYPAANHDPAVFANPHHLDLVRTPNPHLAFGGAGPHYCLGAHLARSQLTAMYRELLHQLPHLDITGQPEYLRSTSVNALKHLPVRNRAG